MGRLSGRIRRHFTSFDLVFLCLISFAVGFMAGYRYGMFEFLGSAVR